MKTVKEFEDLGVEFVEKDECKSPAGSNVIGTTCYKRFFMEHCGGCEMLSFAWRPLNTLPDNPKFKYEIGGNMPQWRPLLDQSSPSKPYDFDEHVSEVKPVFTQEMTDMQHELGLHKANSELLATLTKFMVKNNIGNAGESCIDVAIRELSEKHGIDTRTPKQKAVDAAMADIDAEIDDVASAEGVVERMIAAGYRKC